MEWYGVRHWIVKESLGLLSTTSQTKQKLLEHLMSSNDIVIINLFSKFISLCLIERENSLKPMENT
jgi:hypothetical protein